MSPSREADAIIASLAVRGLLDLADAVCKAHGVTRQQLCGRGRSRVASAARQELWWLIRNHPERRYSFLEIARMVRRDHSTIFQGIAAHLRRQQGVDGA